MWSRSATRRSCSRTTRASGTSTGSPPRATAFSSGNTLTSRVRRHHIYSSDHIGAPRGPDLIPRYRRDRDHAALRCGRRSEEHTSELQSQSNLVCRLLLEKKKKEERKNNAA